MFYLSKFKKNSRLTYTILFLVITGFAFSFIVYQYQKLSTQNNKILYLAQAESTLITENEILDEKINSLISEDQYVKNQVQQEEIKNIHETYKRTVITYENLLKLRDTGGNTDKLDELIAKSLSYLSNKNYASAEAALTEIDVGIKKENETLAIKATEFIIPKSVAINNAPPASGYQRQQVSTELGNFLIDIVSADLGSTRVIIDTASDGNCIDNCPVLPLADYVSRSGAFAGINGSYFCPASYPSCNGKTNSFDTLLMNKNKVYFNSDNNVYSTVPVAVFGSGWARFMGKSLDWGRETGVDGVIASRVRQLSNTYTHI